jgi:hypothetical protein
MIELATAILLGCTIGLTINLFRKAKLNKELCLALHYAQERNDAHQKAHSFTEEVLLHNFQFVREYEQYLDYRNLNDDFNMFRLTEVDERCQECCTQLPDNAIVAATVRAFDEAKAGTEMTFDVCKEGSDYTCQYHKPPVDYVREGDSMTGEDIANMFQKAPDASSYQGEIRRPTQNTMQGKIE